MNSRKKKKMIPDLTENDVLGADHQQVALKLFADFVSNAVFHGG